MDSADFKQLLISALIVIVPVLFSYISEKIKKVRRHNNHATERHRPEESVFDWHKDEIRPTPPVIPETQSSVSSEEGQRVTEDAMEQTPHVASAEAKNPALEDLRKAVIWSEILTPKFNNH